MPNINLVNCKRIFEKVRMIKEPKEIKCTWPTPPTSPASPWKRACRKSPRLHRA